MGVAAMNDRMNLRLRQLHAALLDAAKPGLDQVRVVELQDGSRVGWELDFAGGKTEAQLMNVAHQLIANIACLGDYLKAWCRAKGLTIDIPAILRSNLNLALIQDLWNLEKHVEITKGSWSTRFPELRDIHAAGRFRTQAKAGSWSGMTIDPVTGRPVMLGDGTAEQIVNATVVDRHGVRIDDLIDIAERAVEEWERHIGNAGVPIPPR